jgi:hypothetical protein
VLSSLAPGDRVLALGQSDADEGLSGSTSSCMIVELYPGYPGYRGNVTGVMPHWGGQGDYACLELLEDQDPDFSRRREDRANNRAARNLGIDGGFEDWTWENWLQIELERGFRPACYSCLILDASTSPLESDHRPDRDDPRLLLGFFGTTTARDRLYEEVTGFSPDGGHPVRDDFQLRAAGYFYAGENANAEELLDAMGERVLVWANPGGSFYSLEQVFDQMIDVGGYVPTTDEVAPSDQLFIMAFTLEVGLGGIGSSHHQRYRSQFLEHAENWEATGCRESFKEYLKLHWNFLLGLWRESLASSGLALSKGMKALRHSQHGRSALSMPHHGHLPASGLKCLLISKPKLYAIVTVGQPAGQHLSAGPLSFALVGPQLTL